MHQGVIEQYEPVIWEPPGVLRSQRSVAAFTDHTTPRKTQALLKNKITHINFLNKTRSTLVAHKLQHMSHNLMCFHTGCRRGCTLKTITFNRLYCTMMGFCFAEQRAVQMLLQTPWSKCNKFKYTVIYICLGIWWIYKRKPLETGFCASRHLRCVFLHTSCSTDLL